MNASPSPTTSTASQKLDPQEETVCESLCGSHIGDRRVRVQRRPRSVGEKVASAVRRVLSR